MTWRGLDPSKARIAVIGAGAAGIASFRGLRDAAFENITVFEATTSVGGTWVYTPETDGVHTPMYASLRVNIPRQAMCFTDVPFDDGIRSFPGHAEVAMYLQRVAKDCGFYDVVRFNTRVARVDPQDPKSFCTGWTIRTGKQALPSHERPGKKEQERSVGDVATLSGESLSEPEHFDAVLVCCGHFSEPSPWRPPGADTFPGSISHCRTYRTPDRFKGKKVVVLGAGPSGTDIALELTASGADVVLSRVNADGSSRYGGVVPEVAPVVRCSPDSSLVLADGNVIRHVDELLLCTGYSYSLPFLTKESGLQVTSDGRTIHGLLMQCVSAAHPTLSVIGMVYKVVPFPLFEDQVAFVTGLLRARVPFDVTPESIDRLSRAESIQRDPAEPEKYLHCLDDRQWDYRRTLAGWVERKLPSEVVKEIYNDARAARATNPLTYREREYVVFLERPGEWAVVENGRDITGLLDPQTIL